ncbi:MAG: tetratricopeptide repeat protein [Candidatus Woesearchaeota archaeon]
MDRTVKKTGLIIALFLVMATASTALTLKLSTPLNAEQIHQASKTSEFYGSMGDYLLTHGYVQQAQRAYEIGLSYGGSPALLHNLGKIAYDRTELEDARDLFQKAIDLDNSYAKAFHSLGILDTEEGRYNDAVMHFGQYAKLTGDADSHCQLGNALALSARYDNADTVDEAISEYKTCISMDPAYEGAENNLRVLERVKEIQSAS